MAHRDPLLGSVSYTVGTPKVSHMGMPKVSSCQDSSRDRICMVQTHGFPGSIGLGCKFGDLSKYDCRNGLYVEVSSDIPYPPLLRLVFVACDLGIEFVPKFKPGSKP